MEADASVSEPVTKEVKRYVRKDPKNKREEIIKYLPVCEILCETAESEQYCDHCSTKPRPLGKEVVREKLEFILTKLQIVCYVRMVYECPRCKHTEHPFIKKALISFSLLNHSFALPKFGSKCEYVNSVPLYRQKKEWERIGLLLSRATMANGVIRCSQNYLILVVGYLRKKLLERGIVHCDETPVQVFKKPQTKSYMCSTR